MSDYPTAIDTLENAENAAVVAIETTLGTMPQGSSATVAARLDSMTARMSAWSFVVSDYPTMQAAIDAAWSAGGGMVIIPPFTTITLPLDPVTRRFLTLRPRVSICGFGPHSVLRVPSDAGNYAAVIGSSPSEQIADVTLCDFAIDGNQAGNAPVSVDAFEAGAAGRAAISIPNGIGLRFSSLRVFAHDGVNAIYAGGANIEIDRCEFRPVSAFEHDHSSVYTQADGQRVTNCRFDGAGVMRTAIETHGSDQHISSNTIRQYRKGMNITGVHPDGSRAASVYHNHILDVEAGIWIWAQEYAGGDPDQAFEDLLMRDNIIRLDPVLWPNAQYKVAMHPANDLWLTVV